MLTGTKAEVCTLNGWPFPCVSCSCFVLEHETQGKGRALDNIFIEPLWRTVKEARTQIINYS